MTRARIGDHGDSALRDPPGESLASPVLRRQALAWGGIVGPTSFVAAWAACGWLTPGYSPVRETISRLCAVRAPMRPLMTAGFVCFGIAVPGYSLSLRESLGGRAWLPAAVAGLATLGAGACPLEGSLSGDRAHRRFAAVAYSSLALTPLLAGRTLSALGYARTARASRLVGALSGACLASTGLVATDGLLQRIGLTLADGWLAASAVAILRNRILPSGSAGKGGPIGL